MANGRNSQRKPRSLPNVTSPIGSNPAGSLLCLSGLAIGLIDESNWYGVVLAFDRDLSDRPVDEDDWAVYDSDNNELPIRELNIAGEGNSQIAIQIVDSPVYPQYVIYNPATGNRCRAGGSVLQPGTRINLNRVEWIA